MEVSSEEEEQATSPRNRVKFMCSHGGKILPRPGNGQLKYIGGDTRIIAVPPNITFSELTNKLRQMFKSEVVLKYQVIPDDLNALVSVTSDEDVKNMLEQFRLHECRRLRDGDARHLTSWRRAFLFSPSEQVTTEYDINRHKELEVRYIEAINSNGNGKTQSEPQRVYTSPNLLNSGFQHSSLPRLVTARYLVPELRRSSSSELLSFGRATGRSAQRGGLLGDKDLPLSPTQLQRRGSPLKPISDGQE